MKRTLTPAEHAALLTIQNSMAPPASAARLTPPKPKHIYMVGLTCHEGECVKPLGHFWSYAAAEAACPGLLASHPGAAHLHIVEIAMGEQ